MRFFLTSFKWIMLAAGLLTCSMFLGLFSPTTSLNSNFGETLSGPVAEVVVRNWSALIGLSGVMLVYGAFVDAVRKFVLVITGTSKLIFITLVLSFAPQALNFAAGTAVIADSVMILLFLAYLVLDRKPRVP